MTTGKIKDGETIELLVAVGAWGLRTLTLEYPEIFYDTVEKNDETGDDIWHHFNDNITLEAEPGVYRIKAIYKAEHNCFASIAYQMIPLDYSQAGKWVERDNR